MYFFILSFMKGCISLLLIASVVAVPLMPVQAYGEAPLPSDEPILIAAASIDPDVRSVADQYINFVAKKFPSPAYKNSMDNGYISENGYVATEEMYWVPTDIKLCQVLAALQGYTRYARNYDELLGAIQKLKNTAKSGGYMPTIAGNRGIIGDLEQFRLLTKLPSWNSIVNAMPALVGIATNQKPWANAKWPFGRFHLWEKLDTGFGSLRQINAWLEEAYLGKPYTRTGRLPKN
jgi:hypothetical protein